MLHQPDVTHDPEGQIIDEQNERDVREKMLDKPIADSFPASDPPSSIPDPDDDSFCTITRDARNLRGKSAKTGSTPPGRRYKILGGSVSC